VKKSEKMWKKKNEKKMKKQQQILVFSMGQWC